MAKHFHCPVNGWDCPYFEHSDKHPCVCTLDNPIEDCDDFASHFTNCYDDVNPEDYTDDHEI